MNSLHTFNEALKRLEPVEKKCLYCELENSQSMDDNYFIPVFKEKDRTNIVVYRSVKYNKVLIGIPRCPHCHEIHQSCASKASYYTYGGIAVLLILLFLWNPAYLIFGIPASIFIGIFVPPLIRDRLIFKKGVFTEKEGAERNETVQEFIINGWSFTQPSA